MASYAAWSAVAAVAGIVAYANLPVRMTIGGGAVRATLRQLAEATLQPLPVADDGRYDAPSVKPIQMAALYAAYSAIAAVAGVVAYANLPVRMTIGGGAVRATLRQLADATLQPLPVADDGRYDAPSVKPIQASQLWKDNPALIMVVRRPGCLLCREEAKKLSSLKSLLDKQHVKLYGVVHETLGVEQFRPFFDGEILLDAQKTFYGPKERWMPVWMGFLRPGTYLNGFRAKKAGVQGNMVGEGRLLGGVYLIGAGSTGILFDHQESEWGDHASLSEVTEALKKLA